MVVSQKLGVHEYSTFIIMPWEGVGVLLASRGKRSTLLTVGLSKVVYETQGPRVRVGNTTCRGWDERLRNRIWA